MQWSYGRDRIHASGTCNATDRYFYSCRSASEVWEEKTPPPTLDISSEFKRPVELAFRTSEPHPLLYIGYIRHRNTKKEGSEAWE